MAWSSDFIVALGSQNKAPMWRVIFTIWDDAPGGGGHRQYVVNSHVGQNVTLGGQLRVGGQRVQVGSWRSTSGAWSFQIVGSLADLLGNITRGSIARLELSMDGGSTFEHVTYGVVNQIRGTSPAWTVECWDILTALASRLTTTADEMPLFYGVGTETTLTADYTAGDNPISVASGSGFEKDSSTGVGLLKITPSTGSPFYLEWSGSPGTSITVGTVGVLGTTATDADNGDTVTACAYIRANPVDLARKVLVSTGAGTNGSYDVLPKSWGYSIPDDVIDHDDAGDWLAQVILDNAGSTYVWDVVVEEPVDHGYAWLAGLLSLAGAWLVVRQGMFTVRAAQNHIDQITQAVLKEHTIYREDEIAGLTWEAWNTDTPAEYARTDIRYDYIGGSTATVFTTDVATLPAADRIERDQTGLHDDTTTAFGDLHRLRAWDLDIGGRVILDLVSWDAARLVPGDVIEFSTALGYGRQEAAVGQAEFYQRIAMVTEVSPNWTGTGCRLGLALLPAEVDLLP